MSNAISSAILDQLDTAVVVFCDQQVHYLNESARALFELGQRQALMGGFQRISDQLSDFPLWLKRVEDSATTLTIHDLTVAVGLSQRELSLSCTLTLQQTHVGPWLGLAGNRSRAIKVDDNAEGYSTPTALQNKPQQNWIISEWVNNRITDSLAMRQRDQQRQWQNQLLLRSLAHEINNPLGGIRGAAQLLQEELVNPAQREYTGLIVQEVDRLSGLLRRVMGHDLTYQSSAPTDMHKLLDRVAQIMRNKYPKAQLERIYDTGLPSLDLSAEAMMQVFINLLDNAIRAGLDHDKQQPITIRSKYAQRILHPQRGYQGAMRISVSNHGVPIGAELIERLFDPFVSGREGGHGFGLYITRELVHRVGGVVGYEHRDGITCFHVDLPLEASGPVVTDSADSTDSTDSELNHSLLTEHGH